MSRSKFVQRALRIVAIALTTGLGACAPTMSVEEARKVTASFSGAFVPPPRTIHDVMALLQAAADTQGILYHLRLQADYSPPFPSDAETLANFYFKRALATRRVGRIRQALDDLQRAADLAPAGAGMKEERSDGLGPWPWDLGMSIRKALADTEASSGNYRRALSVYEEAALAVRRTPIEEGWLFELYAALAELHATVGDLKAAASIVSDLLALQARTWTWNPPLPQLRASWNSAVDAAQAHVLELRGRYAEAEQFWRQSIAALLPYQAPGPLSGWLRARLDARTGHLARCLLRQGRLLEAEVEARKAVRSAVNRRDPFAYDQLTLLIQLGRVLRAQGRYAEAEALARATIRFYKEGGASPISSATVSAPRQELAALLVAQGRWQEALAEYETVRTELQDDELFERLIREDLSFMVALLKAGRPEKAAAGLEKALQHSIQTRSDVHTTTAEIRGLLAMARTAFGDSTTTLQEFRRAARGLLDRTGEVDDEGTTRRERDQRLGWIVASYIGLLVEAQTVDAVAEAFRVAEAVQGRLVQRDIDASAARSAVKDPLLAVLVREEQDAGKQIGALHGLLVNALDGPVASQAVADLRGRIEALQRARKVLNDRIQKEFPAYAQLIHPAPIDLTETQALLRPGEALISTYVTDEKTFVWALPHRGTAAFAAVAIDQGSLAALVERVRAALDPRVSVLGEIPAFDAEAAHQLYAVLLEPVRSGWHQADTLLTVTHGPLGQLPFSVLLTRRAGLGPEGEPLFSRYRTLPWLARTHAVARLPSVSALRTLRRAPPHASDRRPFVGFGDPYFSEAQARAAEQRLNRAQPVAGRSGQMRSIALRNVVVSPDEKVSTSALAALPRLPDTADEIRSIALAMGADPEKDVFLGPAANEHNVKTLDLSRYRVIAFATHGLVPGDLDGLTQPALALSAPEVARAEGDGLLTMEEILALRLHADWVVLSACNTANGNGAGAEAIAGLGRAFFYAGARALLVTSWPVETTSARALTTGLFRLQTAQPALTRARALYQTMNALMDEGELVDPRTERVVSSYAHPLFWAPFVLVGDGGN